MGGRFAGVVSGVLLGASLFTGAAFAKHHYDGQNARDESMLLASDGSMQAPEMTLFEDLVLSIDEKFYKSTEKQNMALAEIIEKIKRMDNNSLQSNASDLEKIADDEGYRFFNRYVTLGNGKNFREFGTPRRYAQDAIARFAGPKPNVRDYTLANYLNAKDAESLAVYVTEGKPMKQYEREQAIDIILRKVLHNGTGAATCGARKAYELGKAIRILAPELVDMVIAKHDGPGACYDTFNSSGKIIYKGKILAGLRGQ